MHQASVGFHCPNCVAKGKQKVISGRAAFSAAFTPTLTFALMGLNIAIFLLGESANVNRVFFDYGLYAGTDEYYRLVTAGFLHDGILHVGLNMWALYNLGPVVERSLGRVKFGLVYSIALLAGSAGAVLLKPDQITVGASGALYGLFGALVILYRHHGLNVMRSGLGMSIILNVVFTLTIPNISVGGHLGGFIGGIIATWVAIYGARGLKSNRAAMIALGALVPVMFVAGIVAMNVA